MVPEWLNPLTLIGVVLLGLGDLAIIGAGLFFALVIVKAISSMFRES